MYKLAMGLTYKETLKLEERYRYDFLLFDCRSGYIGFNKISQSVFVFRTIKKYAKEDILNNVLLDVIDYRNLNGAEIAIHGDANYHFIDTKEDIGDSINLNDNIEIVKRVNEFEITYYASIKNQSMIKKGHYGVEDSEYFKDMDITYKLFTKNQDKVINCTEIELPHIFKLQKDHIEHNDRYYNANRATKCLLDENEVDEELKKNLDAVKSAIKKKANYLEKQEDKVFNELVEHRNNRLKYKIIKR